jgi:hypothetical protein
MNCRCTTVRVEEIYLQRWFSTPFLPVNVHCTGNTGLDSSPTLQLSLYQLARQYQIKCEN